MREGKQARWRMGEGSGAVREASEREGCCLGAGRGAVGTGKELGRVPRVACASRGHERSERIWWRVGGVSDTVSDSASVRAHQPVWQGAHGRPAPQSCVRAYEPRHHQNARSVE
eukprot:2099033-Prymnesium_polylepis.1